MTHSPDTDFAEFIVTVRDQAAEIATLDSPRAEAWASDVLSLAGEFATADDPVADLVAGLAEYDDDESAAALCALQPFGICSANWAGSGAVPPWADVVGTSRCEAAWLLRARAAESATFRFVDAADVGHVLTVDLAPGEPETLGEVAVGPADLLDALEEEDAGIDVSVADPASLAKRVDTAMRATRSPVESAVVNGHLLVLRLASLIVDVGPPPVAAADSVPNPPPRDPDDDAYAVDLLERALRIDAASPAVPGVDPQVVADVALAVSPIDLAPFTPAERDAVLALEWADWLGAVIGLVRAGPGTPVDGMALVDLINRCPEVASTIPKADRARIAWAFDTLLEPWAGLGVVVDGTLSELGAAVLPAALRQAWAPRQ